MQAISRSLLWTCLCLPQLLLGSERATNSVISSHSADLVVLSGDRLVPFKSESFFKAPYTVLYFGAGWCPDCRRFSPALVDAYDRQSQDTNRFEVLLISRDKDPQGMLKFMIVEKMRWPGLAFQKIDAAADLNKLYSGHGIPCLTVIDSKGTVVLQSKDDQDALEVLHQLQNLVNKR